MPSVESFGRALRLQAMPMAEDVSSGSDNCCQMSKGRSRKLRAVSSFLLTSAHRTRFSNSLALPGNGSCVSASHKLRVRRESSWPASNLMLLQKVLDQGLKVCGSLAQRWDMDGQDIETMKEVGAKRSLLYHGI